MRLLRLLFLLLGSTWPCYGQHFLHAKGEQLLYFRKNGHREAVYRVGDAVALDLKNSNNKISGRITGFEDSLIVLDAYKINPQNISALYVDDKTKIWFILRYKYEKLFFLTGALFLPINTINTGKIEPRALLVSGSLLSAGLLARWLISRKIKIRGHRKLVVISY